MSRTVSAIRGLRFKNRAIAICDCGKLSAHLRVSCVNSQAVSGTDQFQVRTLRAMFNVRKGGRQSHTSSKSISAAWD
eukprot:5659500-Alexandrium_andersonii.AAC.1